MKSTCIFLLGFTLLFACNKKETSPTSLIISDRVKTRIDSTLKIFVDSGKVAGVSALIYEKNKEVYYNAFGYADREAKVAMDRNTLVRIFSMTKPVTGVALMKLFEQGAFQQDDSLAKFAPEFANMKVYKGVDKNGKFILEKVKRPITIRDITRHTAGFAVNIDTTTTFGKLIKDTNAFDVQNTLSDMAKKLGSLPLAFHPGDQWAYGPSVDVQAFLVARISGKPFDEFVYQNVLKPLGMTQTRYVIPPTDTARFAACYHRSDDGLLTRVPDADADAFNLKKWPLTPGGYGLTSTLDDYMRFAQMLVNKGTLNDITILKPETITLMSTNHLSDSVTERMWLPSKGQVGFGIDFAVRLYPPASPDENMGVVGEFFWDGAASTLFWVDPVNDITAVLFVQLFPYDQIKLHKSFREAIYK